MFNVISSKCISISKINGEEQANLTINVSNGNMRIHIKNNDDEQTISIPPKKVNKMYRFIRDILRKIKSNNIKKPTSFGCICIGKNKKLDLVFTYDSKSFLMNISNNNVTNTFVILDILEFMSLYALVLASYAKFEVQNGVALVLKYQNYSPLVLLEEEHVSSVLLGVFNVH